MSNKTNNLKAYLRDLYEGIVSKKPDASRNPQKFRDEIEAIRTGGELYEVMDASELPEDAPNGSLALVEVEGGTGGGASGIIEVNKLPTENIDTNALYLCNGEYYRYQESGNTWVFNEILTDAENISGVFNFEFEGYADTKNGTQIYRNSYGGSVPHLVFATDQYEPWGSPKTVVVYAFDEAYNGEVGWLNDDYRYVKLNEEPTDETFITWFKANAKQMKGWVKLVVPSGTMLITKNGRYEVTEYKYINVSTNADLVTQLIERTVSDIYDDGATSVGSHAFYNNRSLTNVDLPEVISVNYNAFTFCMYLRTLNLPKVTSIGIQSFQGCDQLEITRFPSSLTSIGMQAFSGCSSLREITFEGTPNTISSDAFKDTANLITINVPWAEGAVASAPWGATNATINYNYTEE